MNKELEVKFTKINKDEIRKKLKDLGATLLKSEIMMNHKTFDFPEGTLPEGEFKWARVRDEGDKVTMNIKHMTHWDKIDGVNEIELNVDDYEKACNFIQEIGLVLTNIQEKYREEWDFEGIYITIDTWPGLDPLIELEGESEEKIKEVAATLGFDYSKAIFGSADIVYENEYNLPSGALKDFMFITFDKFEEELERYRSSKKV